MLDNITVLSQSRDEERDGPFWKVAIFALVGIGANLLAVSSLSQFLATANPDLLYVIGVAGLVALTVFVLQALFVKSAWILRLVVFLEAAAPLALFFDRFSGDSSLVLFAAVAAFFLYANMGSLRGLRQAASSTAVRFFDVARTVVGKSLTGALILTMALVYLTYFSWGTLNDSVGRRFVNQMLTSADPVLRMYFSRASVDSTVGELLREVVRAELEGGKAELLDELAPESSSPLDAFHNLPVPQRDAIIERVAESFRESLEAIVGPLDPSEPVRDAVYRLLEERLSSLTPSQYATFTIGGVVLVFFALKGFFSLFHWLIAVVAYLVFKLLVALGFARIGVATQTREFVILS